MESPLQKEVAVVDSDDSKNKKSKVVWTFKATFPDLDAWNLKYSFEFKKSKGLIKGNRQNATFYLRCGYSSCPYRIKFVEETVSPLIHEYESADKRVAHNHDDVFIANESRGMDRPTLDWVDSLIALGFTSAQRMHSKMLTTQIPNGASIPRVQQLRTRIAYVRTHNRKTGDFNLLGSSISPESLRSFAHAQIDRDDVADDALLILAFRENTAGADYRCQ